MGARQALKIRKLEAEVRRLQEENRRLTEARKRCVACEHFNARRSLVEDPGAEGAASARE